MTAFAVSHRAPATGLATWPEPDGTLAPGPSLSPYLPVMVVEQRGEWARIRCENGWEAWVDARLLEIASAPAPAPPAAPPSAGPRTTAAAGAAASSMPVFALALAGAAATVLGALLPWLSLPGASDNGFDVPVAFLLSYEDASDSGLGIGIVLVVLAVVVAGAAVRRLDAVRRAAGGASALVAVVYVVQLQRLLGSLEDAGMTDVPSLTDAIGFGVLVALAGGLLSALAPAPA